MKITLAVIGKTEVGFVRQGIEEYVKRLQHYVSFNIQYIGDVKGTRNMSVAQQKVAEGRSLLAVLESSDHVVLLDKHQPFAAARHAALQPLAVIHRCALGAVFVKQHHIIAGFECSEQEFALGNLLLGLAHVSGALHIADVLNVELHVVLQSFHILLNALTDKTRFGLTDHGKCNFHN